MRTDAIYGAAPVDLGRVDLSPAEMMFWLYCPVKLPGMERIILPDNLRQFSPIIDVVRADLGRSRFASSYVYVTAKTLFSSPENPGNRPGWHSDGFLTDDLNYIWYDANPTIFWVGGPVDFAADHAASLDEMQAVCGGCDGEIRKYQEKHILRLDQRVMHRVDTCISPGVRTFVKVSVSNQRYALKGNSVNHALAPFWEYKDRGSDRNCPTGAK